MLVKPEHLTFVKNTLKRRVPECRVIAFGSRVDGTARATSDLDICLIGDQKISFETLADVRDEFSNSNIPYKVDVIDWQTISPDFQKIILESFEEIQKAQGKS